MRFVTTVFLAYTYPGLCACEDTQTSLAQRELFRIANETNFYSGEYTQTSLAQREFFRI